MPMNYDFSKCANLEDLKKQYNLGEMGVALSISFMNFKRICYTDMYANGFQNGPLVITEDLIDPFSEWLHEKKIFFEVSLDDCKRIVKDFLHAKFWRS